MASNGKKEYTLKINGISQAVKDTTKLEEVLSRLDATVNGVNTVIKEASKVGKENAKAMTEEEKAAKKLEEVRKKLERVGSEANKAQINATQALREATRETTRKIQYDQLAEGSIKKMGMRLTDMRNQYEGLSRAQRENAEEGGVLLQQIQELDAEYKRLRESTGNFRDSVGHYEKATEGLGKLSEGVEGITKTSMGLAQSLLGASMLMSMFGEQSEESAKQALELQKILALLSIIEQVNTNIVKEGIIQNKLAIVVDGVRTAQIKAKTAAEALSTKGTIAATVAQRVFNAVASANPYVLLALALISVVGALYAFSSGTEKAAEKQKRLNELQDNYLDSLETEANRSKEASDARISDLERQIKVLEAQGNKQKEIRKIEGQILAERKRGNKEQRETYAKELADLEKNRVTLIRYEMALKRLKDLRGEGTKKVAWAIELDGNVKRHDIDDAIEAAQKKVDQYGRKVQVAVGLNAGTAQIVADIKAQEEKEKREKAEKAKEVAAVEREALRAAEDAKFQLIQNADERARQQTEANYNRQIEDLKRRLSTETNLTAKARTAINEQIAGLELKKGQDLENLKKNQAERMLELEREVNAGIVAVMEQGLDKQLAGINLNYDNRIKDLEKQAEKEENKTAEAQARITQLIKNAQDARGKEIQEAVAEDARKRADLELSAVDDTLAKIDQKLSKATVREKNGLQLIDVEATRKNLAEVDAALNEYIGKLEAYKAAETAAHQETLASLKKGTPEYEAEVQRYARAMEDATRKITEAQDKQKKNTEDWADVTGDAIADLLGKIVKYADVAAQAVTSVTDTLSMSLGYQIEALNEQLDAINDKYEESKKQREDDAKNVEDIEARLREATGGTAEALKSQLQDALKARQESAREEQRLAREKEKLEKQIAKKEKEQKRAEMVGNIAQGVANTAQGVTQVLATVPIPFKFPVAFTVGAMGLAQVGIMTQQLTKLEKGGEIKGPSHANGGVPIPGTNYEAEGGEFVINKHSYSANAELVRFINDSPRPLTITDLTGFLPGESGTPVILDASERSEDRIIEAIQQINFSPKVAVTDIIDATDEITTVQDIAGF